MRQFLIALIGNLPEPGDLAGSIAALTAAQSGDGSWADDVFSTALVLRALGMAAVPPIHPDLGVIKGSVSDGRTDLPMGGVNAELLGPTPKTITTEQDGMFEFRGLTPGAYTLQLAKPDYDTLAAGTAALAGQTVDFGTLRLLPEGTATSAVIRGAITDAVSRLPLEGALVAVAGATALTDALGAYQITNVSPGSVTIQATMAGYSTASGTVELEPGGLFLFSAALTPQVAPATELLGSVTDGATGMPLSGVLIRITGSTTAETLTDTLGEYHITGLNPGEVTLEALLVGYDQVVATATIYENNVLNYSPRLYLEDTTPPPVETPLESPAW